MALLNNGVTGHRGDPQHFPQNTLAGFASAINLGCDWVETDIRLTRDGKLVLIHNPDTCEQGDVKRVIADTDFDELRKINVACNFNFRHFDKAPRFDRMPSLEETLELFRSQDKVRLSLQPKAPGAVEAAAKIIRDMKFPVELLGFNDGTLDYMVKARELFPESYIFFDIAPRDLEAELDAADRYHFNALVVWEGLLDQKIAERILERGYPVGVWNIQNPGEMRRYLDMKVSRFYTDYPAELMKIMGITPGKV